MKVKLPQWGPEAISMRKAGIPIKDIAAKFKVTPSRVSQIWTMAGEAPMPGGRKPNKAKTMPTKPWIEQAIALSEQGLSKNLIAVRVDKSVQTVKNALFKHNRMLAEQGEAKERAIREEKGTTPMADRQFDPVRNYKHPETGALMNGVIIRCGKEGCDKRDTFLKAHGVINPVHAASVFRNRGWAVGSGPRADRCPEHVGGLGKPTKEELEIRKAEHAPQPNGGVTKAEPAEAPKVEAPKVEAAKPKATMLREDKRIIFAKLNDVYGDAATGYQGDWNDEKIATDLGVAKEWVAQVREENFGPERNAEITAKVLAEARELAAKINAMAVEIKQFDEAITVKVDAFDKRFEEFEKATAAFAELYKSIAE